MFGNIELVIIRRNVDGTSTVLNGIRLKEYPMLRTADQQADLENLIIDIETIVLANEEE